MCCTVDDKQVMLALPKAEEGRIQFLRRRCLPKKIILYILRCNIKIQGIKEDTMTIMSNNDSKR